MMQTRKFKSLHYLIDEFTTRVSPLGGGLWPPSSSSGWAAFHSSALWISGGMGGAVGMWEPCTWKPFSSASHVMLTCWPSGATYASEPCETTGVSFSTCFGWPDSWWLIPLLVSKLTTIKVSVTIVTIILIFFYIFVYLYWNRDIINILILQICVYLLSLENLSRWIGKKSNFIVIESTI